MADLENEVVKEAVERAQKPVELLPGKEYAWLVEGRVITEDRADAVPAFKAGTVQVLDVASFAHYFGKHGHDDSEVFADMDEGTVTAVIDAHSTEYASHQKHRLVLVLKLTRPWLTWTQHNGPNRSFDQGSFADFLDDNYPDVAEPDAADLREIVRKFNATVTTTVKSHQRPESGTISFTFDENVTALGGRELEIPAQLVLSIKPYDDCDDMTITAKLRYKVDGEGQVRWHYVLDRPEQVVEQAVTDVVAKVADAIGEKNEHGWTTAPRTIMRGEPSHA